LTDVSPTVPSYRRELANCCNNLATVLKLRSASSDAEHGDLEAAAAAWQRGRELAEGLLAEKPDMADYHWLLGALVGNLGALALDQNDLAQAATLLQKAVNHETIALDFNPQHPTYRAFLRTDLSRLARALVREGEHAKAVEAARRLPELFPDTWQEYQRAAKLIAQCVPLAMQDEIASDESRKRRSDQYADEATSLFQHAVDRGYQDWQDLKTNPILDPLQAREDFRRIVAELESKTAPVPSPCAESR
jgi:tetratricopeptide (TPR) repeat protein